MVRRTLVASAFSAALQSPGFAAEDGASNSIVIAPLFYKPFTCAEHSDGQLSDPGDALGSDFFVPGGLGARTGFPRLFKTDGAENEDWYGWHVEVHAPFDGVVTEVHTNSTTNKPGTMGSHLPVTSSSSVQMEPSWSTPISTVSARGRATA